MEGASSVIDAGLGAELLVALETDGVARCADHAIDGLRAELRGDLDEAQAIYRGWRGAGWVGVIVRQLPMFGCTGGAK